PQFTDDANTVAEDAAGRVGRLPAYHLLDLGVHYRHARTGLRASLTVKNALDQIFVIARRPEGDHPTGFRQVVASLRWGARGARGRGERRDYEGRRDERHGSRAMARAGGRGRGGPAPRLSSRPAEGRRRTDRPLRGHRRHDDLQLLAVGGEALR